MPKFVFPVSALAFGADPLQRLSSIISWCTQERGQKKYQGVEEVADQLDDSPGEEFAENQEEWMEAAIGGKLLGVKIGCVQSLIQSHDLLDAWLVAWKKEFGPQPNAQIGCSVMWQVVESLRKNQPERLSYDRFASLLAVNSIIGNKPAPYIATRNRIRAAAMGYKSARMIFDDSGNLTEKGRLLLDRRSDGAAPRTTKQIRQDLDFLERAELADRLIVNQRHTAFYNRSIVSREKALEWLKSQQSSRAVDKIQQRRAEERNALKTTK